MGGRTQIYHRITQPSNTRSGTAVSDTDIPPFRTTSSLSACWFVQHVDKRGDGPHGTHQNDVVNGMVRLRRGETHARMCRRGQGPLRISVRPCGVNDSKARGQRGHIQNNQTGFVVAYTTAIGGP